MTNPYESPTQVEEPPPLQAARGEPLSPEYRVLFVIALFGVIFVNTAKLATLHFQLTLDGLTVVLQAVAAAAGLAAIPLAAFRGRQRARTFPVYLGHWLLLTTGIYWLVMLGYDAWNVRVWESYDQSTASGIAVRDPKFDSFAVHALTTLAASTVHWLALRAMRRDRLCQAYLAAAIAGLYWLSFSRLVPGLSDAARTLIALPLGLAVIVLFGSILLRDLRQPNAKDRMHWVGMGSVLLAVIAPLANLAAALWQFRQAIQ